jgi:hypothetical protein
VLFINRLFSARIWKAAGGAGMRKCQIIGISNSLRERDYPFYIAVETEGLPAASITKARLLEPFRMFHLSLVRQFKQLISNYLPENSVFSFYIFWALKVQDF